MFTEADRAALLTELIAYAQADPSVTACALVGSTARQTTDRWSDIDLALRLAIDADPLATAASWRAHLELSHNIVDHLDLWAGSALYRVFLFADTLQVDLSFWPSDAFSSNGEPFELLFGEANSSTQPGTVEPREVIGWAWLYALHARSAIACGRPWRALHMMDGLRDRIITLGCLRHGVPAHQGRGVDQLPETVLDRLGNSLVGTANIDQLNIAFDQLVDLLAEEVQVFDFDLAARLHPALTVLVTTTT